MRCFLALAAVVFLHGDMVVPAAMAGDKDKEKGCLDCHPDYYKERKGKFNHRPFKEKECEACHVFHAFSQQMELAGTVFTVCTQCHASVFMPSEEDLHHPVTGDEGCMSCHEPHAADNELFLKELPPALCLGCHEDESASAAVVHPPYEDKACGGCHDPHGTEFSANLSLPTFFVCLDCHDDLLGEISPEHLHSGDGIRSCENCHVGHFGSEAHLLKASVPDLCFGCHADQKEAADSDFAHAVVEDCLDCHTVHVHRTDLADKTLCAGCHDFEDDVFLVEHDVADIDSCVDCHNPHGSSEEFMLE